MLAQDAADARLETVHCRIGEGDDQHFGRLTDVKGSIANQLLHKASSQMRERECLSATRNSRDAHQPT